MIIYSQKEFEQNEYTKDLAKHYNLIDVCCKHCLTLYTDINSQLFFDKFIFFLTSKLKKKYKISSLYRCTQHNKNIGGASNSAHLYSIAVDILIPDKQERKEVIQKAYQSNLFFGIGFYDWGLHLDTKLRGKTALWRQKNGQYECFKDIKDSMEVL